MLKKFSRIIDIIEFIKLKWVLLCQIQSGRRLICMCQYTLFRRSQAAIGLTGYRLLFFQRKFQGGGR